MTRCCLVVEHEGIEEDMMWEIKDFSEKRKILIYKQFCMVTAVRSCGLAAQIIKTVVVKRVLPKIRNGLVIDE